MFKKIFKYKKSLLAAAIIIVTVFYTLASPSEKINYITETAKQANITKTVDATGEVAAIELVSVGSQVSGQIEKLNVVLGQELKKGDLIAQIDSTTQQNELGINKAKLKSYKAKLESAEISLKVLKSQFEREKSLAARGYSSNKTLDKAEDSYVEAKAKVEELKSLIEQTQIEVNTSETNLGYTTITAPFDGTVVSIPVKEGQTVNATQSIPTIVEMANLDKMAILIKISEGDVTKIKPYMEVTYSILSEPNKVYSAILQSIDPGLTTLTNGTYTGIIDADTAVYYYGRAIAPNDNKKLFIGMTTQNEIIIDKKENVIIAPSLSIYEKEGKKYINILEQGKSVQKEVVTGISDNINTEIISGINKGDTIIVGQTKEGEIVNAVDIF